MPANRHETPSTHTYRFWEIFDFISLYSYVQRMGGITNWLRPISILIYRIHSQWHSTCDAIYGQSVGASCRAYRLLFFIGLAIFFGELTFFIQHGRHGQQYFSHSFFFVVVILFRLQILHSISIHLACRCKWQKDWHRARGRFGSPFLPCAMRQCITNFLKV